MRKLFIALFIVAILPLSAVSISYETLIETGQKLAQIQNKIGKMRECVQIAAAKKVKIGDYDIELTTTTKAQLINKYTTLKSEVLAIWQTLP